MTSPYHRLNHQKFARPGSFLEQVPQVDHHIMLPRGGFSLEPYYFDTSDALEMLPLKVSLSSCFRDAVPRSTPDSAHLFSLDLISCFSLLTRGSYAQCVAAWIKWIKDCKLFRARLHSKVPSVDGKIVPRTTLFSGRTRFFGKKFRF